MALKTLLKIEVKRWEILDAEGQVDAKLEPDFRDDLLVTMYKQMVRARRLDERAYNLSLGGRIRTFPPSKGQEATQIGTALALEERDWLVPDYRSHPASLVRGFPMVDTLLYWGCDFSGVDHCSEHNSYPISVPVGSQMVHAVGEAYGHMLDGEDIVVMTYFGDGATSEGDFHEAMNFAGAWQAPVVFVCQNNQYAISVPRCFKQCKAETLAQKAFSYGFEGVQVDGNDVLAVHQVAKQSMEKARKGDGPTLIECTTYRLGPHTTPDDPSRYRTKEEEAKWVERDPISRFQIYLEKKGVLDPKLRASIEREVEEEVGEAVRTFENRKPRSPGYFFDNVYATKPWNLQEQKQEFLALLEQS